MRNWIAEAIGAAVVLALGLWAKFSFVHRSELYDREKRPRFAYRADCAMNRAECNAALIAKIVELRNGQDKIWSRLDEINRFMGRIEQYIENGKSIRQ